MENAKHQKEAEEDQMQAQRQQEQEGDTAPVHQQQVEGGEGGEQAAAAGAVEEEEAGRDREAAREQSPKSPPQSRGKKQQERQEEGQAQLHREEEDEHSQKGDASSGQGFQPKDVGPTNLPPISAAEALESNLTYVRVLDVDNQGLTKKIRQSCDRIGDYQVVGWCLANHVLDVRFAHPRDAVCAMLDIESRGWTNSHNVPVKLLLKRDDFDGGGLFGVSGKGKEDGGGGEEPSRVDSRDTSRSHGSRKRREGSEDRDHSGERSSRKRLKPSRGSSENGSSRRDSRDTGSRERRDADRHKDGSHRQRDSGSMPSSQYGRGERGWMESATFPQDSRGGGGDGYRMQQPRGLRAPPLDRNSRMGGSRDRDRRDLADRGGRFEQDGFAAAAAAADYDRHGRERIGGRGGYGGGGGYGDFGGGRHDMMGGDMRGMPPRMDSRGNGGPRMGDFPPPLGWGGGARPIRGRLPKPPLPPELHSLQAQSRCYTCLEVVPQFGFKHHKTVCRGKASHNSGTSRSAGSNGAMDSNHSGSKAASSSGEGGHEKGADGGFAQEKEREEEEGKRGGGRRANRMELDRTDPTPVGTIDDLLGGETGESKLYDSDPEAGYADNDDLGGRRRQRKKG